MANAAHKNYDKLMNSKNADVQNINYVGGVGSTTAAQFLQRFVLNKTPGHLDIAGMHSNTVVRLIQVAQLVLVWDYLMN